jgi:hypothetical protein
LIYLFGFIGSILAANALIATFSVIPVGFGLLAPAGVLAAGAALSFRDGAGEWRGLPAERGRRLRRVYAATGAQSLRRGAAE